MTTNTTNTDQQVTQGETLDGAAIINRWRGMNVKISRYLYQSPAAVAQLCEMIDEALRNERERAAKVAEAKAAYHVLRHAEFLSGHARVAAGHSGSKAEACSEVASAIREGR